MHLYPFCQAAPEWKGAINITSYWKTPWLNIISFLDGQDRFPFPSFLPLTLCHYVVKYYLQDLKFLPTLSKQSFKLIKGSVINPKALRKLFPPSLHHYDSLEKEKLTFSIYQDLTNFCWYLRIKFFNGKFTGSYQRFRTCIFFWEEKFSETLKSNNTVPNSIS